MIGWLWCLSAAAAPMDSVYLIMVDRFANGRTANDQAVDTASPTAWHGGDLAGIRANLDYIEQLGVSTVWITPITRSRTEPIGGHPSWHGYWVADGRAVDPRFGTLAELKALRDDLHSRGMSLMMDLVLNHVGPETPLTTAHPEWFRTNGDVTDWTDDAQRRTHDVHGLPDLDHSQPAVVQHLLKDGRHWIRSVGPDAIRVDAVRHLDVPFLTAWIDAMKTASPNPIAFAGEVYDGNAAAIAREAHATGLTHTFDFPLHYAITESVCESGDLRKIPAAITQDRAYPAGHQWITFLDNHDTARIATVCGDATKTAIALMMSLRGIPSITWGTAQGMTGRTEVEARGDMVFATGPFRDFIADRLDERRSYPPLANGRTEWLTATATALAFARVTTNQAIIVATGEASNPPALPKEAGSPTWVSLPDAGLKRWLLTPAAGTDFSDWTARLDAESTATKTVTLTTASDGFISGSDPAVGAWDSSKAVGPGTAEVQLPSGGVVALKSLKQTEDGRPVWSAHPDTFVIVNDLPEGEPVKVSP
ncbi:MAG: alpha-amylase family glycosyl hydrolase [Myxococcota bacterium]|nr:alpha-amylase family glycosyl hydrolase [Myxococcota bacterium]